MVELNLQVRGIKGLRVADASIFPQVLTANLHAACATWSDFETSQSDISLL